MMLPSKFDVIAQRYSKALADDYKAHTTGKLRHDAYFLLRTGGLSANRGAARSCTSGGCTTSGCASRHSTAVRRTSRRRFDNRQR